MSANITPSIMLARPMLSSETGDQRQNFKTKATTAGTQLNSDMEWKLYTIIFDELTEL